jgi:prepilin-type N-terminal cleavage/methylation domain-containing protein
MRRRGFTILELSVTLSILSVAMALAAQVGIWSLRERAQTAARLAALELAANIMESARALPWEGLSPDWAATQQLPESLSGVLPDGRVTVRVLPEESRQQNKRVTVTIDWKRDNGVMARPVELVGLFSARSPVEPSGGNP